MAVFQLYFILFKCHIYAKELNGTESSFPTFLTQSYAFAFYREVLHVFNCKKEKRKKERKEIQM